MKTTTHDPIVDEARKARHDHAAQFDYDIKAIFRSSSLQAASMCVILPGLWLRQVHGRRDNLSTSPTR